MGNTVGTKRVAMLVAVLAGLLMAGSPAHADLDQDGGGWLVLVAQGDFGRATPKLDRLLYWFDHQVRFLESNDGFSQTILRPALGWRIFDSGSLWLGYTWVGSVPENAPKTNEHQLWQQFSWSEPSGRFTRLWRTRLEQRWRDDSADVGLRLRQLFKTTLPIRKGSPVSIAAFDEVFFHLKSTDWGQEAGFDENRFFLGVAWTYSKRIGGTVEIGYQNRYIDKRGGTNVLEHLALATFFFNNYE